jgi:hypothetical protein
VAANNSTLGRGVGLLLELEGRLESGVVSAGAGYVAAWDGGRDVGLAAKLRREDTRGV